MIINNQRDAAEVRKLQLKYGKLKNFIHREIFGKYLTAEDMQKFSPETRLLLKELARMERRSNIARGRVGKL